MGKTVQAELHETFLADVARDINKHVCSTAVTDEAEAVQKALAEGIDHFILRKTSHLEFDGKTYSQGSPFMNGSRMMQHGESENIGGVCYVGFDRVYSKEEVKQEILGDWRGFKKMELAKRHRNEERAELKKKFAAASAKEDALDRIDALPDKVFLVAPQGWSQGGLGRFFGIDAEDRVFDKTGKLIYSVLAAPAPGKVPSP